MSPSKTSKSSARPRLPVGHPARAEAERTRAWVEAVWPADRERVVLWPRDTLTARCARCGWERTGRTRTTLTAQRQHRAEHEGGRP